MMVIDNDDIYRRHTQTYIIYKFLSYFDLIFVFYMKSNNEMEHFTFMSCVAEWRVEVKASHIASDLHKAFEAYLQNNL